MNLPAISRAHINAPLRCPWCREYCDEAKVTLADLQHAHAERVLEHPPRNRDDTAPEDALTSACPHCAKPFMVGLRGSSEVVLVPVRTAADAAFRSGRP